MDSFEITHESSLGGPHSACARLGDMAIFGDLGTMKIFVKKIVCLDYGVDGT